MEAVPALCPHFLAVGPAVPVTGQGSLGSRAVPLGSVPFPQRRQDQPCDFNKVLLKSNLPETCHQVRSVRPAGGLGAALRTEDPIHRWVSASLMSTQSAWAPVFMFPPRSPLWMTLWVGAPTFTPGLPGGPLEQADRPLQCFSSRQRESQTLTSFVVTAS